MAIVTRETTATGVTNKGAPLTNAELDNNFVELSQRYKSGDSPSFDSVTLADVKIGGMTWSGVVNGDYYLAVNAYHDGTNWMRYDTAKVSWLYQFNVTNNMIFEGHKACNFWRCQPGTNPINGFTNVGGWLIATSISEYGDFVLGGFGIEIDGNFTTPYSRVQHATIGGVKHTGIVTNAFMDYSGRDDTNEPSLFSGWVDDDTGNPLYKVRYAPPGASLNWKDLLSVNKDGVVTMDGSGVVGTGVEQYTTPTDEGMSSQWIEPLCSTRLENGIPFAYWGACDGTTGEQKVHRCNLSSGKLETKVVLNLFAPDDHNAPAVYLHPDGEIIIACAGHNDNHNLYYDVFEDWDAVTTITNFYTMPTLSGSTGITYAQIVKTGPRIHIFTRIGVLNWSYIASEDKFTTLLGGTSYKFLDHTEQCYIMFRGNQNYLTNEDKSFESVRVWACGNGSTMTDRTIRRTTIAYQETTQEVSYGTTLGTEVMGGAGDTGGSNFSDWTTLYTAPVGKRFRMWDGFVGEGPHLLVTEYDEADPYGNAKNYLLYRVGDNNITKYEVPIPVGDSIPFKTYFPGMCFPRPKNLLQLSVNSAEIFVATNDGYDGTWEVKRAILDLAENSWSVRTVVRKDGPTQGRPKCVVGAEGGYADVMYSLVREYNTAPPSPAYENYNGKSEVLLGASRANRTVPSANFRENVTALPSVYTGVPLALNAEFGTLVRRTLTQNETFLDELYNGESLTLMLNTGSYTVTWPTMTWVGGSAPSLETSGYNVIVVWKAGGVLYGSSIGVA